MKLAAAMNSAANGTEARDDFFDALAHPLKALKTRFGRICTEGPMAPEIPLEAQRPAAFVHDQLVSAAVARLPERQKPHSERSHAA